MTSKESENQITQGSNYQQQAEVSVIQSQVQGKIAPNQETSNKHNKIQDPSLANGDKMNLNQTLQSSSSQNSEKAKPIANVNQKVRQSILFQKFCLQQEQSKRESSKFNNQGKEKLVIEQSSDNSDNYDRKASQPFSQVQRNKEMRLSEDNQGLPIRQQNFQSSHSRSNSPPQKVAFQQIAQQQVQLPPDNDYVARKSYNEKYQSYPQQSVAFQQQRENGQHYPMFFVPFNYSMNQQQSIQQSTNLGQKNIPYYGQETAEFQPPQQISKRKQLKQIIMQEQKKNQYLQEQLQALSLQFQAYQTDTQNQLILLQNKYKNPQNVAQVEIQKQDNLYQAPQLKGQGYLESQPEEPLSQVLKLQREKQLLEKEILELQESQPKQIQDLRKQIQNLQGKVQELESMIKSKEEDNKNFKTQLEKTKQEYKQQKIKLEKQDSSLKQHLQQLKEKETAFNDISMQLKEQHAELKKYIQENESIKKEISRLQDQNKLLENDNDKYIQQLQQSQQDLASYKKKETHNSMIIEQLSRENNQIRIQLLYYTKNQSYISTQQLSPYKASQLQKVEQDENRKQQTGNQDREEMRSESPQRKITFENIERIQENAPKQRLAEAQRIKNYFGIADQNQNPREAYSYLKQKSSVATALS